VALAAVLQDLPSVQDFRSSVESDLAWFKNSPIRRAALLSIVLALLLFVTATHASVERVSINESRSRTFARWYLTKVAKGPEAAGRVNDFETT
jgi:hypothetical protein